MDKTTFCSCEMKFLSVYVGYHLAKIIKYKCPVG